MSWFIALAGGRKLFVEYARWATPDGVSIRREQAEVVVWIGRWHAIYTPLRWAARPRNRGDGEPGDGDRRLRRIA